MNFILGNLSPEAFATRVEADFTDEEIAELKSNWSTNAELTGPEDWHIFDDPVIRIHIGSIDSRAAAIFIAANERKAFNRAVTVHLDEKWKRT